MCAHLWPRHQPPRRMPLRNRLTRHSQQTPSARRTPCHCTCTSGLAPADDLSRGCMGLRRHPVHDDAHAVPSTKSHQARPRMPNGFQEPAPGPAARRRTRPGHRRTLRTRRHHNIGTSPDTPPRSPRRRPSWPHPAVGPQPASAAAMLGPSGYAHKLCIDSVHSWNTKTQTPDTGSLRTP